MMFLLVVLIVVLLCCSFYFCVLLLLCLTYVLGEKTCRILQDLVQAPPTDNTRPTKSTEGHFHHSIFLLALLRANHENTKNNLIKTLNPTSASPLIFELRSMLKVFTELIHSSQIPASTLFQ